jgi:type IX secretion system PorP/SprF family membrane protein
MKKILLLAIIVVFAVSGAKAQQLSQYSQYLQNPYIINPATTAIYDYMDVNLSFRKQWAGFSQSPTTAYISAHAPFKKKANPQPMFLRISDVLYHGPAPTKTRGFKHGMGGSFSTDEYGAFTNNTFNLSYGMHIPVGKKFFLGLGIGGGASMIRIDQTKVTLANATDNTYSSYLLNGGTSTIVDLKGGVYFYSDKFHIGYASNQLLQNKIYFGNAPTDSKLNVHHFVNMGYKFKLNDNLSFTPGVLVKFMRPAPISVDVNLKFEYMEKFWGGISIRPKDAVVAMVGMTIKDLFKIGYSYDYTTTGLSNYSSGSHEIILGFMLFK